MNISTEQCIARPLDIVQRALDNVDPSSLKESSSWGIPEFINKKFQVPIGGEELLKIPSLNDFYSADGELVKLPSPASETMVRFRCMVQDTLNQEYYLGVYQYVDPLTGVKKVRTGKYNDIVHTDGVEINIDDVSSVTYQRMTM